MDPSEMRDASYHLKQLERRLFNLDSEGLLFERLDERGIEWAMKTGGGGWAMKTGETQPDGLKPLRNDLDRWLTRDFVLPDGSFAPKFRRGRYREGENEAWRYWRRWDQICQMRNSFGMGVFVGAGLFSLVEHAHEQEHGQQAYALEVSVESALELLPGSSFSPDLIESSSELWPKRMQDLLSDVWTRTSIGLVLSPIPRMHGFFGAESASLTPPRLNSAKRCLMLAGLISSGLELPPEQEEDVQLERSGDVNLINLSDEALENLLGQAHLRESIQEELRYRLRNNRLGRMLAHLERTSKDEHEDNGAAGDE
ncbi:MAG: hypothetical protein OSB14_09765 [Planctomycetota bacterium]|nr:hypothetical protein [Planctomycetota bacterium]